MRRASTRTQPQSSRRRGPFPKRLSLVLGVAATTVAWSSSPRPAQAACDSDMTCSGGPARIMLVVDASSDMLNDGMAAGSMGTTLWDVLRQVVAGTGDSLYDAPVEPPGPVASQVAHFGLTVFGNNTPAPDGEARILVDYAPCSEPRVDWALDPLSSCVEPDCTDPWAGPPITWTYQDGSIVDPPGFAQETLSHMPLCDGNGMSCEGSMRFPEPAIALVTDNHGIYGIATPYVNDGSTRYVNIMIIAGPYDGQDVDVQVALEGAFEEGIETYVLAYGPEAASPGPTFEAQLISMAEWGSNGMLDYRTAENTGQLTDALREIVDELQLPCCASIDCSHVGGADGGVDGGSGDAADWGGLDGTAGADASGGASMGGTMSGGGTGGSGSAAADELDDDGGCTCRGTSRGGGWWALGLLPLGWRRRRR